MYHLAYLSSAKKLFSSGQLESLLERSRRNNASLNITGMLLYRGGNFLQVLEGEEAAVRSLFEKISLDRRHGGIIVLFQENIAEREFANWSMGFRDLSITPETFPEGFNDLLNADWAKLDLTVYSTKVRPFVKLFSSRLT